MDRNALDWLFSTAPQALAALAGLIFAGVVFMMGVIDKEVERDETLKDIYEEMKREIHGNLTLLYWLAGSSIIIDLILIILNPVEDGFRFSFIGTFDWYFLISAIIFLLNVATLVFSLWFIIKVMNPNYFSKTAKRLSESANNGIIESKEFLMEYIEMEKAMRDMPIFNGSNGQKQTSVSEMLRELRYRQLFEPNDIDRMYALTRMRNLIIHGSIDNTHVEKDMYEDVKRYKNMLVELKSRL